MERLHVLNNLLRRGKLLVEAMLKTALRAVGALLIVAEVFVGERMPNILSETDQVKGTFCELFNVTFRSPQNAVGNVWGEIGLSLS